MGANQLSPSLNGSTDKTVTNGNGNNSPRPSSPSSITTKNYIHSFKERESILTEIFQTNTHIKSFYNLLLAVFVLFVFLSLGQYLLNVNELLEDFKFTNWAFRNLHIALSIMSFLFLCSSIQWMIVRLTKEVSTTFWTVEVILIMIFTFTPIYLVQVAELSPILKFAVYLEQLRNAMKNYSLVAENIYLPPGSRATYGQFCYFMFAPTLLYRSSYPRSKIRSWLRFTSLFLQFLASIFIVFATSRRFVQNRFSDTGLITFRVKEIPFTLSNALLCGLVVKFCIMYGFLHCWFNMWAEALQFADRCFYDAWWLSSSFSEFYRKWNLVVHVWLHTYIYNPLNKKFDSRGLAAVGTILISSFFHEYALALALGFFYPILSIQYCSFGTLLYFATLNFKGKMISSMNALIFALLILGYTMQSTLIPIEYYSRLNCRPAHKNIFIDFFIPRTISCVRVE